MWVLPRFDGDVDMEVANKQHDVYGQALGIIVRQCNQYAEFAQRVLDDADHSEWGTVESFDHRVLQDAHDLLAAAWRFRNDFRQSEMSFMDKNSLDEVQELWLDWLRHEASEWLHHPERVRWVQLILTNQNKPLGYIVEAQLALNIINEFSDVPWNEGLREAHEANLANTRAELKAET